MKIRKDGGLAPRSGFVQHTGGSNVNKRRQSAPHAHSINLDASEQHAYVADLGLDQILIYDVNTTDGTRTLNLTRGVKATLLAYSRTLEQTSARWVIVG